MADNKDGAVSEPSVGTKSVSVGAAGGITTALTLGNVIVGFGFQSVVAAMLGLGALADQFQFAWAVVTFGTVIFATMVTSLLVPRIRDNSENLNLGDAPLLVSVGFAAMLAQAVASVFCDEAIRDLLLWSSPCHLLAAISSIAQAVAYLEKKFAVAAATGIANGVGLLAGVIAPYILGATPWRLGLSLTIGYLFQTVFILAATRNNYLKVSRSAAIGWYSLTGVLLFTMVTKLQPLLERAVSESSPGSSTAALGFGQKITQGLLLFGAFGLALTATGSLSTLVQTGRRDKVARLLAQTFVATLITSSVVVIAFLPFIRLAIKILFERGEFTAEDTDLVAKIVLAQIPWVLANALTGVLTGYLYIVKRFRTVGLASVSGLITIVVLVRPLSVVTPNAGVAIASSLGSVATFLVAATSIVRSDIGASLKSSLKISMPAIALMTGLLTAAFVAGVVLTLADVPLPIASTLLCAFPLICIIMFIWVGPVRREVRRTFGAHL